MDKKSEIKFLRAVLEVIRKRRVSERNDSIGWSVEQKVRARLKDLGG